MWAETEMIKIGDMVYGLDHQLGIVTDKRCYTKGRFEVLVFYSDNKLAWEDEEYHCMNNEREKTRSLQSCANFKSTPGAVHNKNMLNNKSYRST